MTIIKSFSVGNGDMFYIKHTNNTLTMIDCNLIDDVKDSIITDIDKQIKGIEIFRFISTHPDNDHINGINELFKTFDIPNFYCVNNKICSDDSIDFKKYCYLRDSSKDGYLEKNFKRKWLNEGGEGRVSSEIFILWPDLNNEKFKEELNKINNGDKTPNNLSPILKYSLKGGVKVLWFGDMEKDFLEEIYYNGLIDHADIIFAPHHGRKTGKIPKKILDDIDPKLIIIGEADPNEIDYYGDIKTITQNTAKNIVFECVGNKVHIYTEFKINNEFLINENRINKDINEKYRGTLYL